MQCRGDEQVLIDVCGRIAHEVGDGTTAENLQRFRAYLHRVSQGRQRSFMNSKRLAFFGVGLACAVLGIAILFFSPQDRGFKFWIGPNEATGISGQRIAATHMGIPVTFEQGSTFVFQKGSVADVVKNSRDSVAFHLEDGKILAHVVGNQKTKWKVAAGPFDVVVVGTRFVVTWNKTEEVLNVEVSEGTVLVEGARYAEQGIKVSQGYALRMNHRSDSFALSEIGYGDAANNGADRKPTMQLRQQRGLVTASSVVDAASHLGQQYASLSKHKKEILLDAGSVNGKGRYWGRTPGLKRRAEGESDMLLNLGNSPPPDAALSTWIEYYEQGNYRSALRAAEKSGIEFLAAELNLEDLWKLMHAARSEGRRHIAETTLLACRRRFGGTKKSLLSAYILGKLYYEKSNDFAAAIDWFSTYLKEDPSGQLAEEAEGRIVTALKALGRKEEANQAASEYLKKYPRGLFSGTARTMTTN